MRILLAVDLATTSHDALLARTDRIARRLGARVDVVYVRREDATLAEIDHYEARLRALLAQIEPARQGVARLEAGGEVDRALAEVAEDYDLAVVGPREPGALERLLRGVMAVRVLRHARCPVLVPRGEAPWEEPPRIVAGVDIRAPVQTMLVEQAGAWAAALGGRLDLVHAVPERIPTIREATVAARAEQEWRARHEVERQSLRALLSHVPEDARGEARLERGEPEDVLLACSRAAELVVVGNRNRSGLAGLVFGPVAGTVVRQAHCDVLTLNTADIEVA